MTSNSFNRIFSAVILSILSGCFGKSSTTEVSVPATIGLNLIEQKYFAGGRAADVLQIYLTTPDKHQIAEAEEPIFEGQEVSNACYRWISKNELEIKIDGGYVDHVEAVWNGPDNRTVSIRYAGTEGCRWQPTH